MYGWKVASDPQTNGFTHSIAGGRGHAMLVPLVGSIFQLLRVSASICDGRLWWAIHQETDLLPFEAAHNVELPRWKYNEQKFAEVSATRRVVRGSYSGTCDLFAPVLLDDRVAAIMVVGPFFVARPTGAQIIDRWRWLTGRQGHPADPQFAAYLRTTLGTLVLEGRRAGLFERLLSILGEMMAGRGRADALANRADVFRRELEPARFAEHMWDTARNMVDEHASHVEYSAARHYELSRLGLSVAPPDQVLVGLCVRRPDDDPVDELVRRDAFQRCCVELATTTGDVISGKVGDHGAVFLFARKKKNDVTAFAGRVAAFARRRFGLTVHFGASGPSRSGELNRSYQAALGASEMALTQNKKLVMAETSSSRRSFAFFRLRDEMAHAAREQPGRLPAQLDRYIEAVSALSGHRLEPARAELAICVERVVDVLLQSGALDQKGALAIRERLDRSSTAASTLADLFAAYRTAILDLSAAAERPVRARHDRGLRGALEHIEKHYSEPISLETVARASGFARTYFSELFRKRQGTTFQRYLVALRIERAKKLLTGTDLSVTRVAELSGHGSAAYLCRVFKRIVGATPLEYRGGIAPHRMRTR